ncbi:hypothetical protein AOC36_02105 [Erysipelothrix larvae]|uniref:Gram-positive cocci surface proteins LPxTG domain-containing protein n=1 Tax=Erysipelothrix larvae TaxID=1514105 RepID=A0A0X8GYX1_9FIRM|nr:DUF11 domain-containing protein [Erysipelothrix larvae]AMC92819.1 hypothetical protein AOC36_02105 [Erysipelothrix larvae]
MEKKKKGKRNSIVYSILKKLQVVLVVMAIVVTSMYASASNALAAPNSKAEEAPQYGQLSAVKFTQITSGYLGGMALDSTGAVWSWGYNADGNSGFGPDVPAYAGGMKRIPYFVDNNINVIQIDSAYHTSYALDDQGNMYAWGNGTQGQIGNGANTGTNPTPTRVNINKKITKMYAGHGEITNSVLALDVDGDIWAWGYNPGGRIGVSGPAYSNTPKVIQVPGGVKFKDIAVGSSAFLAISTDGELYSWGNDTHGALGRGTTAGTVTTPTLVPRPAGMEKVKQISICYSMVVALDEKNQVWQWGALYGRGTATGHVDNTSTPIQLTISAAEISDYGYTPIPTKVFAGESVSYFVDQYGRPWAWGDGRYFGFGREGGYEDANSQLVKEAEQWPKVIGDGDTQIYDRRDKLPMYLSDPANPSGVSRNTYGGYSGINALHPTIYDEKYMLKDQNGEILDINGTILKYQSSNGSGRVRGFYYKVDASGTITNEVGLPATDPEESIWIDLALKDIPSVVSITTSRSSYTLLDKDGNIYKWGNDGSGSIAWGWDYDPKYDQNGSLERGLYDRYSYEVIYMRGAPTVDPIDLEIEKPTSKIYLTGAATDKDTIEIKATLPASYTSNSMNIIITPQLNYMKYVIIPYDESNPDFNVKNIDVDTFNALYAKSAYKSGTLVDTPIKADTAEQVVTKTVDVTENSRVIVMIEDVAYGRKLNTVASYIATNFYTPTDIFQTGLGDKEDGTFEVLYAKTQDQVDKADTPYDNVDLVGIPLDAKGQVINNPTFGYDGVKITAIKPLPNNEDIYWNLKATEVNPLDIILNDVKYMNNREYIHEFFYERNMDNWAYITYEGVDVDTNQPVPGFKMDVDNPELVKKYIEIARTAPTITDYEMVGYYINDGTTLYDLDSSNQAVFTPDKDTKITFVYGQPKFSGNKAVSDANGDGFASPGETLTYVLTAKNDSNFNAKNVVIQDEFKELLNHINDPRGNALVMDVDGVKTNLTVENLMNGITTDIKANGTVTFTFSVTVKSTLDTNAVDKLENTATIKDTPITVDIPTGVAILSGLKEVTDTDGDKIASPGEAIEYKISVSNNGTATASDVLIQDTLASVLGYVDAPYANQVVIDDNGSKTYATVQDLINGLYVDVKAGQTVTVTFKVTLLSTLDVKAVTSIDNSVKINDVPYDASIPTGKANLVSSKTVTDADLDGFASPGEVLSYLIKITNDGSVAATNVEVKDTLDTLISQIKSTNVTVSIKVGNSVTVTPLSELQKGFNIDIPANTTAEISFNVTLIDTLDVDNVKFVENKATINGQPVEEKIPTGKSNLIIDKVVKDANNDGFASPNEKLNYTITVQNSGDVAAKNVQITDKLAGVEPYIKNASSVIVRVSNGLTTQDTSLSDLQAGLTLNIAAKETVTIEFTVELISNLDVKNVTAIENVVTVDGTDKKVVIPTGGEDVVASKSVVDSDGDGFASPGERIYYRIEIVNNGSVKATDIVINDLLSEIKNYVVAPESEALLIEVNGSQSNANVQALMNGMSVDIEPNGMVVLTFGLTVKPDLDVKNVPVLKNVAFINNKDVDTTIPTGDSSITDLKKEVKDANGDGFAQPGEELSYTISAKNTGKVEKKDLIIQDELTEVLKYVEDTSNVSVTLTNGTSVTTHSIQDLVNGLKMSLGAGNSATVTFTVKVKSNLDVSSVSKIENIATIDGTQVPEEIPTGNKNLSNSNKAVSDANGNGYAEPNEELTYVITVVNDGDVAAKGIVVQDELTEVLQHVNDPKASTVTIVNNGVPSDKTVQDLINGITLDVDAHSTATLTFKVTVKGDLDVSQVNMIRNIAVIDGTPTPIEIPTGDKDLSTSTKTVQDSDGDGLAAPQEDLHYTLSVNNTGNVEAKDVLVKDELTNVLKYVNNPRGSNITITANGVSSTATVQDLINGITLDVAANSTTTIEFTVTVDQNLDVANVPVIENTAEIGNMVVNASINTGKSDLALTKDAVDANNDGFVSPSEDLTYTITAVNNGDVDAKDVFVKDTLFNLLPNIKDISMIEVELNNGGQITNIPLQNLVDGFNIDIKAKETLVLTFTVTAIDTLDVNAVPYFENKVTFDNQDATKTIPTGDSSLTAFNKDVKDANNDGFASPGETLTYTISVNNSGAVTKKDVIILDELTEVLQHVMDTSSTTVTLTNGTSVSTHTITELVNGIKFDLQAGDTATVTFSVSVKSDLDVDLVDMIRNIAVIDGTSTPKEIPTGDKNLSTSTKSVTDENGDGIAAASEELTYTLTAINTGKVKAKDIVIQDELKDVLKHVDDPRGSIVEIDNNGTKSQATVQDLMNGIVFDLDVGATATFTFKVKVIATLDTGNVKAIANTATIDKVPVDTTIPTGAEYIVATKQVVDASGDGIASPSEVLTYTISVMNQGTTPSTEKIIDELVDVLKYVEDPRNQTVTIKENGVITGQTTVQNLIDGFNLTIDPGDRYDYSFDVTVRSDLDVNNVSMISNTVFVSGVPTTASIPTGDVDLSTSDKVVSDANGNGYAEANETLTYKIIAKNTGKVDAKGIVIQDELKDVLNHVNDPKATPILVGVNNIVMPSAYTVQDLINGITLDVDAGSTVELYFDVTVISTLDVSLVDKIKNTATIGKEDVTVIIPTAEGNLTDLDKKVVDENQNGYAEKGETLTYTITAKNSGIVTAKDVMIKDELTDVLQHVEDTSNVTVTLTNGSVVTTHSISDLVNGIIFDINPNDTATITFTVKVKADLDVSLVTKIVNIATINNVPTPSEIPTGDGTLTDIDKTVKDANGNGFAEPGEDLTYEMKVTNSGAVTANDLEIKDELLDVLNHIEDPSNVSVVLTNDTHTSTHTIQELIAGIHFNLDAGKTATVTFTVRVKSTLDVSLVDNILNTATIGGVDVDEKIPTGDKDLTTSTKSVDDANHDGIASPNEVLTYTITAINSGKVEAKGIVIQDELIEVLKHVNDPRASIVEIDNNGTKTQATVQDLINGITIDLAAGANATFTFKVTVLGTLNVGLVKEIANKATVDGVEVIKTIPTGDTDLLIGKTVVDENTNRFAEPGEKLTYTIFATNNGKVEAKNFTIKDELAGVLGHIQNPNNVSVTLTVGSTTSIHTLAELMNGLTFDLGANESASVVFTVTLLDTLDVEQVQFILNTATIGGTDVEEKIPTGDKDLSTSFKSVSDANGNNTAEPGEELTYTITAINIGKVEAKGIVIQDKLSEVLKHVNDPRASIVEIDNNGTKTQATVQDLINGITIDLAAGATATFTFKVTVLGTLDVDFVKEIANKATIGGEDVEEKIPTGDKDLSTSFKSVSDANGNNTAEPGEELTYTIHAVNTGKVEAKGIVIQDKLSEVLKHVNDPRASIVEIDNNGTKTQATVQDLINGITIDLAAGATATFTFKVTVLGTLDVDFVKEIANKATIGGEDVEEKIPTGDKDLSTSFKSVSDANGNNQAEPGEELTYTIHAINTGKVEAKGIVIQDKLSEVLKHVNDPRASIVEIDNNGTKIQATVQDLINGITIDLAAGATATFTFKVTVLGTLDVDFVKEIANKATIGGEDVEEKIPTGDKDLSTSFKSVSDANGNNQAEPGEELTYTIHAINTGKVEAKGIVIQDKLIEVLKHVNDPRASIVEIDNNGTKTQATVQDLINGITIDLAAGATATFTFKVTVLGTLDVDFVKEIANKATIGGTDVDEKIPTGDKDLSTSFKSVSDANGNNQAEPGEELTYTIHAINTGKVEAKGIVIQDKLSEVLKHVNDPRASVVEIDNNGTKTQATVQDLINGITIDLAAGATATFTFKVTVLGTLDVDFVKEIANQATIGGIDVDEKIPTGNTDLSTSYKSVSDANGNNKAEPGEELTYTIHAINTGKVEAKGIVIQDKLIEVLKHVNDPRASIVEIDNNGTKTQATVQDLINGITIDLAAGATATFTFKVTVIDTLNVNTVKEIANKATIGGIDVDEKIPTGNKDLSTSYKSVSDANGDGLVQPGEELTYTIHAINTGNVTAKGVLVQDELIDVLKHVDDPRNNTLTLDNNGTISVLKVQDLMNGVTLDIAQGGYATLTFKVKVLSTLDVKSVSEVANTATIDGDDHKIIIPTGDAILDSSKSVQDDNRDGYASPGEKITYQLTSKNTGTAKAIGVEFKDQMEDLLKYTSVKPTDQVTVTNGGVVTFITIQDLINGINVDINENETVTLVFETQILSDLDVDAVTKVVNKATIGSEEKIVEIPTTSNTVTSYKEVKDASGDGYASPGEALNYKLSIKNNGKTSMSDVFVQDKMETLLSYIKPVSGDTVTINNNGTLSSVSIDQLIKGLYVDIAPEALVEITFTVVIIENLNTTDVKEISNVATLGGKTVTEKIPTADPNLNTSKKVSDANGNNVADKGEVLSYTISATNTSSVDAYGVLFYDSLVDVLPYVNNPSDNKVTINNAGTITEKKVSDLQQGFSVDLKSNETVNVSFEVTVKEDINAKAGEVIRNTATVGKYAPTIEIPLFRSPDLPKTGLKEHVMMLEKSLVIIGTALLAISIIVKRKEELE